MRFDLPLTFVRVGPYPRPRTFDGMRTRAFLLAGTATLALAAAGCGGSSGSSGSSASSTTKAQDATPAGDIPDNQAYVAYKAPTLHYQVKVPEGWSRQTTGAATSFADKLNSITLSERSASAAPSVATGQTELKRVASLAGFKPGKVSIVRRNAGTAVRVTYEARGPQDPVTGRSRTRAFERYEFFHKGRVAVVRVAGAKGADNVDPWRKVTDSLRWTA
jgi:hypothetical protein